jgi:hypothetical protein
VLYQAPVQHHVSLLALIKVCQRITTNHLFEQLRSVDAATKTKLNDNFKSWTDVLRAVLTIHSTKLLTEQLKLSLKHKWSLITDKSIIQTEKRELTVNVTTGECSCGHYVQFGLVCRHVIAAWIRENDNIDNLSDQATSKLANYSIRQSHRRWKVETAMKVFECQPALPSTTQSHTVIVDRPAPHIPATKLSRQLEMDDLIERLKSFAAKDDLAIQIAIEETNHFLLSLETSYATTSHYH